MSFIKLTTYAGRALYVAVGSVTAFEECEDAPSATVYYGTEYSTVRETPEEVMRLLGEAKHERGDLREEEIPEEFRRFLDNAKREMEVCKREYESARRAGWEPR